MVGSAPSTCVPTPRLPPGRGCPAHCRGVTPTTAGIDPGSAAEIVIGTRHAGCMATPASRQGPNRIELPISEARMRFLQLLRQIPVTRQTVVVVDQGQPVLAMVPAHTVAAARHQAEGSSSAAGWLRRLEEIREEMRRQHAAHATELLRALEQTWDIIDALRPPGADGTVDMLRATQAHLRSGG